MSRPWRDGGPIVVAFGGNALLPDPDDRDPEALDERLARFTEVLVPLLGADGAVLVHGNGPQVGRLALRAEAFRETIPPESLDELVAQTQGAIGYRLAVSIRNRLRAVGRDLEVAAVVTQVVVDPGDPAFAEPTKPIGGYHSVETARRLEAAFGWRFIEVPGRGFRRVVPSPRPLRIVEEPTIADAAGHGHVLVAGGGGGVPVIETDSGLRGVEAVVDKDHTAAVIAVALDAAGLVVVTGVPRVAVSFGTPGERPIDRMSTAEARRLLAAGEFPAGSMGPKVEAAIAYADATSRPALITDVEGLVEAVEGGGGTWVMP